MGAQGQVSYIAEVLAHLVTREEKPGEMRWSVHGHQVTHLPLLFQFVKLWNLAAWHLCQALALAYRLLGLELTCS